MKVDLVRVSDHEVDTVWPYCVGFLQRVMNRTQLGLFYDYHDLKDLVVNRQADLWVFFRGDHTIVGTVITEVLKYPKCKALNVKACGMHSSYEYDWVELIAVLERHAQREGCTTIFLHGRIGWKKVLKEGGYDLDSIVVSKVLE